MTEKSQFWYTDGFTGATGDGGAPYTQEEFRAYNAALLGEGVVVGAGNELAVTGATSPLAVATGRAQVAGFHYWSDAIENLAVTTPSTGTTGGRVVLRADWTTATIRLAAKTSSDGVATIPALTQTLGATYEISLASFAITTGGVIALTDTRVFAASALASADDDTLETNSDGFLQVKDDGIDDTKAGDRIPQFYRRQGGDASAWSSAGNTNYTPGAVRIQAGVKFAYMAAADTTMVFAITFPVAFSGTPIVFPVISPDVGGDTFVIDWFGASDTVLNVKINRVSGTHDSGVTIQWMAIGPE